MVFNELEGLKSSKKEKTSQNAEEAIQFIIQNNIRFLTTSGKLLAGKYLLISDWCVVCCMSH